VHRTLQINAVRCRRGGNALPAPPADEATAAAPDVADLPLGGGGGGVTEVDPTSTLAETVETADAVALGRVASVDAGPSYGDDPGLGNIGYAHVILEIGEAMKGETRPIVIDMPMFGRDLTDVAAALHGLRMLVFLRSLRVDAENAGQPALTGVEAGHFRILNMHGWSSIRTAERSVLGRRKSSMERRQTSPNWSTRPAGSPARSESCAPVPVIGRPPARQPWRASPEQRRPGSTHGPSGAA